jgi:hypothetical protein
MKIWISDIQAQSHRIIKLQCEDHSGYEYLGDFDDEQIREFFIGLQNDIDVESNLKRLKYYKYLHLFIIRKN